MIARIHGVLLAAFCAGSLVSTVAAAEDPRESEDVPVVDISQQTQRHVIVAAASAARAAPAALRLAARHEPPRAAALVSKNSRRVRVMVRSPRSMADREFDFPPTALMLPCGTGESSGAAAAGRPWPPGRCCPRPTSGVNGPAGIVSVPTGVGED